MRTNNSNTPIPEFTDEEFVSTVEEVVAVLRKQTTAARVLGVTKHQLNRWIRKRSGPQAHLYRTTESRWAVISRAREVLSNPDAYLITFQEPEWLLLHAMVQDAMAEMYIGWKKCERRSTSRTVVKATLTAIEEHGLQDVLDHWKSKNARAERLHKTAVDVIENNRTPLPAFHKIRKAYTEHERTKQPPIISTHA